MPSLDKKYRPPSFKFFYGNEEVVSAIESLLENRETFPASILLQGITGCGKTTIGRIIAKELKIKTVYELNIGHTGGVEQGKNIVDNLKFSALSGSGKVIILNEVQGATKNFWDSMLEALEEPPPNVHFVLCTTNPEKLPDAVKTRQTTFTLKPLKKIDLKKLLRRVLKKEKASISQSVKKRLLIECDGIPRTLLLMLNAIINVKSESKQIEILENFSLEEDADTNQICQMLLNRTGTYAQVMKVLKKIDKNPEDVRRHLCNYMGKVLMNGENPRAAMIIEEFYEPVWNVGKAGLALSIFNIFQPEEE